MKDSSDNLPSRIGSNLRSMRMAAGLQQKELAERADVHESYVGAIERGDKNLSALITLQRLSQALGADIRLLFGSQGDIRQWISAQQSLGTTAEPDEDAATKASIVPHQDPIEAKASLSKHLNKRGVADNLLIGQDIILKYPYSCVVTEGSEDKIRITINGGELSPSGQDTWSTECHKIVLAEYRRNSIYFVTEREKNNIEKCVLVPLQSSRWKMLNTVPRGGSISKQKFVERNKKDNGQPQTDAPRRWRELKSEYGFNVDLNKSREYKRGEEIAPVENPEPRPNMSALKRKFGNEIYEKHNGRCNMCKVKVSFNRSDSTAYGLLDHRVPVPYGGDDEKDNLQLFCQRCNNKKTQIIKNMPQAFIERFQYWAYPEKYNTEIRVSLSPEDAKVLELMAEKRNKGISEIARYIIRRNINK